MKSMIRKDLYNIAHNAKSMVLILLFLTVVLVPSSGTEGCIIVCAFLCGSMILTTFSFDENSHWTSYAMVMPVSRRGLVAGKYVVMILFCAIGAVCGLVLGILAGLATGKASLSLESLLPLFLVALVGLAIAMIMGATSIPLLFHFGAEKARMLLVLSTLIPSGILLAGYELLKLAGLEVTDRVILRLLYCLPVIALIWSFASYLVSCRIFRHKELA